MSKHISHVTSRWILDSRGLPTVECAITLNDNHRVTASVPSGASTGSHEALELRDNDPQRFLGKSVFKALHNINQEIAAVLIGQNPTNQEHLDKTLIQLDGTPSKKRLGANAILASSIAIAKAGAYVNDVPIYQHIAQITNYDSPFFIPIPQSNVINGGAHAGYNLDFQEYMLVPNKKNLKEFPDQLEAISTTYQHLKEIIRTMDKPTTVGDEGGFAPKLHTNEGVLLLLQKAISMSGYIYGDDLTVALDLAANEFFKDDHYSLKDFPQPLDRNAYISFLDKIVDKYHLISIEDPLHEDDLEGWQHITKKISHTCIVVGDDYTVTNINRLKKAINNSSISGIILKPNQIGSVTETIEVATLAHAYNIATIVAHRSGDTSDSFIADLAVGIGADFVKFGAPARGERIAKYNRLLEIYQEIV